MDMMLISLAFVVGFILGGLIAFIAMTKFSAKHKLIDEMTKIKRANANKDRMIVEFFENAQEQFSLLNKVYINYAKFMQNNAERFVPQETEFLDDTNEQDLESLKVKKKASEKATAFVPETQTKESFIPDVNAQLDSSSDEIASDLKDDKEKISQDDDAKVKSKDSSASEKQSSAEPKITESTKDDGMDKIIDDISIARIAEAASKSMDQKSAESEESTHDESVSDTALKSDDKEVEVKEQPKI